MDEMDRTMLKIVSWTVAGVCSLFLSGYLLGQNSEISQSEYAEITEIKTNVDKNSDKGYDYLRVWIKESTADSRITRREYNDLIDQIKDVQKDNTINELRK